MTLRIASGHAMEVPIPYPTLPGLATCSVPWRPHDDLAERMQAVSPDRSPLNRPEEPASPLARIAVSPMPDQRLHRCAHDARQRAARQAARDPQWLAEYRQHRPMVERTIAWLARGNRRVRYRGVTKNDHWLHRRAAALNLRRLIILGLHHTGTNWVIA
jgi:hypothetical protein